MSTKRLTMRKIREVLRLKYGLQKTIREISQSCLIGNGAIDVTVSPDGKNVYATGSYESAIAVFNRDLTTGTLTFDEVHKDGINGVDGLDGAGGGVTVSPDGKNVYATVACPPKN